MERGGDKMTNKGTIAINIHIPEQLHKTFKVLAATKGMTYRELLISLMEASFKEDKTKAEQIYNLVKEKENEGSCTNR